MIDSKSTPPREDEAGQTTQPEEDQTERETW